MNFYLKRINYYSYPEQPEWPIQNHYNNILSQIVWYYIIQLNNEPLPSPTA